MPFFYSNHTSTTRKYNLNRKYKKLPTKEPMGTIEEGINASSSRRYIIRRKYKKLPKKNVTETIEEKQAIPSPQAARFQRSSEILDPRNDNATTGRPKLERQDKSFHVRQSSDQKPVVVLTKARRSVTPVPISPKRYRLRRPRDGGLLFNFLVRIGAHKVRPHEDRADLNV
jgi:hypothetical protein